MLFPRPAVPEMRGVLVAVGIPGAFVLGARLLMTIVFQSDSRNADYLLKGIVQGVLVYHAILSSYNSIALALFLGISGRLAGDFVRQRDHWKLASTLLGVAFGILMADVVSHLTEDSSWTSIEIVDDTWDERSRRRHAPRRRISEPRRIEELPSVYEELSSIDSRSWAEETEGRTDVEMEVSKLRAKALHAAGQRRRFREERKWAWSQGNFARAFQLRWQVKKYDALAGSFTREADAKLIEADRAKRKHSPPVPDERQHRSDRETPFVQVVVERGVHERDDVESDSLPKPASKEYKVNTTTSRVTKSVGKLKPGIQVDSRGVIVRSGRSGKSKVLVEASEPPTSDTWSRELD